MNCNNIKSCEECKRRGGCPNYKAYLKSFTEEEVPVMYVALKNAGINTKELANVR
jgi:hypothetical protein